MGRNTRLDSPGAERDQDQPDHERLEGIKRSVDAHQGEHPMASAIDHAQRHDGQILAEEDVGDQCPEDGSEIDRGGEQVVIFDRRCPGHRIAADGPRHQEEELRHEDDQDPLHAVKTEPFRRFVADDVRDPLRDPSRQGGRGEILRRHRLYSSQLLG